MLFCSVIRAVVTITEWTEWKSLRNFQNGQLISTRLAYENPKFLVLRFIENYQPWHWCAPRKEIFFGYPPKSDALVGAKISFEKVDFLGRKCLLSIFLTSDSESWAKNRYFEKKLPILTYFLQILKFSVKIFHPK